MGNTKDNAEKKPVAAGGPAGPAQHASKPMQGPKGKQVAEVIAGMCRSESCKAKSDRFDFCAEHYEQFKFGLITKLGLPVPDYEKKWDHYQAFKARTVAARKVA